LFTLEAGFVLRHRPESVHALPEKAAADSPCIRSGA
jgi:hypothetical protein